MDRSRKRHLLSHMLRGADVEQALVFTRTKRGANRLAEQLGIRRCLVPADAGLLSAYGLGAARIERFAERQVLRPLLEVELPRAPMPAEEGSDFSRDAYMEAVELYPLGIGVRLETAVALLQASRVAEARQMAEDVLLIVPDNPDALAILEAATDG